MNLEHELSEYLHKVFPAKSFDYKRQGTSLLTELLEEFCILKKLKFSREVGFEANYEEGVSTGVLDFVIITENGKYPIEIDSTNKRWSHKKLLNYPIEGKVIPIWIRWNTPIAMEIQTDAIYLIDLTAYHKTKRFKTDKPKNEIDPSQLPKRKEKILLSQDSEFWFGLYQGKRIVDVFIQNPKYVEWCISNIYMFKLMPEAIAALNSIGGHTFSQETLENNHF
jgi:hypothetical protein